MIDWIKEDAQAKGIVCRKLSPVVQGLLSESSTAREQWDTLAQHFGRLDMSSQFELCAQLFAEKLKDADDVSCYISVFKHARRHFAEMAITFTDDEAVFLLLLGLPEMPEWIIFKRMTMSMYNNSSPTPATTSSPMVPKMGFTSIAASLSKEVNHIRGERKLNGPGSEYANAIGIGVPDSKANIKTGIHMHKSNPKGVACDNPACVGLPRSLTHDRDHCFQPGGGMEGKGGLTRNKKPAKSNVTMAAVTASTSTEPPSYSSSTDLACAIVEELDSVLHDLSPSMEDMACIARHAMSTILDSGTTSTLITNRDFFWNFSTDEHVVVKTANHGCLPTSGRGDCVADLMIGDRTIRVCLTNCLHAPGAMVNLLSVGYMVQRGWAVNFLPDLACCQLPHGKLHFIIFLDDHTNLLNVQLLASKDQALDAWNVICAC